MYVRRTYTGPTLFTWVRFFVLINMSNIKKNALGLIGIYAIMIYHYQTAEKVASILFQVTITSNNFPSICFGGQPSSHNWIKIKLSFVLSHKLLNACYSWVQHYLVKKKYGCCLFSKSWLEILSIIPQYNELLAKRMQWISSKRLVLYLIQIHASYWISFVTVHMITLSNIDFTKIQIKQHHDFIYNVCPESRRACTSRPCKFR
jgi:hypothetical protein